MTQTYLFEKKGEVEDRVTQVIQNFAAEILQSKNFQVYLIELSTEAYAKAQISL